MFHDVISNDLLGWTCDMFESTKSSSLAENFPVLDIPPISSIERAVFFGSIDKRFTNHFVTIFIWDPEMPIV